MAGWLTGNLVTAADAAVLVFGLSILTLPILSIYLGWTGRARILGVCALVLLGIIITLLALATAEVNKPDARLHADWVDNEDTQLALMYGFAATLFSIACSVLAYNVTAWIRRRPA